jgi:hypothetical protein
MEQVRSFFSADEYWQSLEVAHRLVFGCVQAAAHAHLCAR